MLLKIRIDVWKTVMVIGGKIEFCGIKGPKFLLSYLEIIARLEMYPTVGSSFGSCDFF